MKNNFKVGDTIICTTPDGELVKDGNYRVIEIKKDLGGSNFLDVEELFGYNKIQRGWLSFRFKKTPTWREILK